VGNSIQQSAALALGRLANYNDELAEAVVSNEILPQLVRSGGKFHGSAVYGYTPPLCCLSFLLHAGYDRTRPRCIFVVGVGEATASRPVQCISTSNVAHSLCSLQVYSLGEQNRFYKKAAAFVLRAVAKHSPPLAQVGKGSRAQRFRIGLTMYIVGPDSSGFPSTIWELVRHLRASIFQSQNRGTLVCQ
jgi:hypothetical protein